MGVEFRLFGSVDQISPHIIPDSICYTLIIPTMPPTALVKKKFTPKSISKSSKTVGSRLQDEDESNASSPENTANFGNDDYLHGFSSDEDSSDDEETIFTAEGVDVSKLPTVAKDDVTVQRKLEKAKRQPVCPTFRTKSNF